MKFNAEKETFLIFDKNCKNRLKRNLFNSIDV